MLDLTGSPALDLAIGLAFIFFLLATLASAIHELIASALGLRARTLEQGLRSMLEDPEKGWNLVDDFYDHDLIRSLYRKTPPFGEAADADAPDQVRTLTRQAKRARITLSNAASPAAKTAAAAALQTKTTELHAARGKGRNAPTAQDQKVRKRVRGFFRRTSGPSYISPRAFAVTVFDNLFPAAGAKTVFTEADELVGQLPPAIALRLKPLIDEAQHDVEKFRTNLERWFDDTMARVSGWYKRKSQIILLVIGALLVPAINANALVIASTLWHDSAIRSAVVAQAQNAVATPTPTPTPSGSAAPKQARKATPAGENAKAAAKAVEEVKQIGVPLGWRGAAVPHHFWSWITMILGWLLTIAAISLGAPFWFDFLGRASRLRSSGKPETPLPATGSGKPNERVP
jgi:hypothetical protein